MSSKYEPKEAQVFWCQNCDGVRVHSADPSTGQFYIQFGHLIRPASTGSNISEAYEGVVFALCPNCDQKHCTGCSDVNLE